MAARVTAPIPITEATFTSSGVSEGYAWTAYSSGATYGFGDLRSYGGWVYESIENGHSAKQPDINPFYWRRLCPVETLYNGATTYGLGVMVYSATTHRVYESLQANNTGNALPQLPETETAWWVDIGSTNKWAAADLYRSTQSVWASPLVMVWTPGKRFDTVGVLEIEGSSVSIRVQSAAAGYDNTWTFNLIARQTASYYEYCFGPFSQKPGIVQYNIPPYSDAVVTVTVTNTAGNCKCGGVVFGLSAEIGTLKWGADADAQNFSKADRNIYGIAALTRRRSIPLNRLELELDKERVQYCYYLRDALNAAVCLWTAIDNETDGYFGALMILGFYRRWTIKVSNAKKATVNLDLEEI